MYYFIVLSLSLYLSLSPSPYFFSSFFLSLVPRSLFLSVVISFVRDIVRYSVIPLCISVRSFRSYVFRSWFMW